jgi:hypothetical protein
MLLVIRKSALTGNGIEMCFDKFDGGYKHNKRGSFQFNTQHNGEGNV